MSRETVLVGSYNYGAGAAYVFVRTGTTWTQQAAFEHGRDLFGVSVALSGDTAVIGAPSDSSKATGVNGDETDRSVQSAGAAYVFVRSGTNWKQEAYLKSPVVARRDDFGTDVAVDGHRVVVLLGLSASPHDKVYVFERKGATWSETASINPRFFSTIAVSGDTVLAGDVLDNSNF
jgi:hypothetical protein